MLEGMGERSCRPRCGCERAHRRVYAGRSWWWDSATLSWVQMASRPSRWVGVYTALAVFAVLLALAPVVRMCWVVVIPVTWSGSVCFAFVAVVCAFGWRHGGWCRRRVRGHRWGAGGLRWLVGGCELAFALLVGPGVGWWISRAAGWCSVCFVGPFVSNGRLAFGSWVGVHPHSSRV